MIRQAAVSFFALAYSCVVMAGDADVKPVMHQLLSDIQALQKYVVTEQEFIKAANEKPIVQSLDHMQGHINHLKEKYFKSDPALHTNIEMLSQHIKETEDYFKSGNKVFARDMLRSSFQMCISCHSRQSATRELDLWNSGEVAKAQDFDQAEYLFATRQFTKALTLFQQIVKAYPENKEKQFNLRKAINSIAIMYVRVLAQPAEGAVYFTQLAQKTSLPSYMREDAKAWAKSFEKWANATKRPEPESKTELLAAAQGLLGKEVFSMAEEKMRKSHVDRLRASVYLHKLLDLPGDDPKKGEALFLLGKIYRQIDNSLFFHFDEMYLRACINGYPGTKVSVRCFDTLRNFLVQGYTGSSGTHMPEDVELELLKLKKLAYPDVSKGNK